MRLECVSSAERAIAATWSKRGAPGRQNTFTAAYRPRAESTSARVASHR